MHLLIGWTLIGQSGGWLHATLHAMCRMGNCTVECTTDTAPSHMGFVRADWGWTVSMAAASLHLALQHTLRKTQHTSWLSVERLGSIYNILEQVAAVWPQLCVSVVLLGKDPHSVEHLDTSSSAWGQPMQRWCDNTGGRLQKREVVPWQMLLPAASSPLWYAGAIYCYVLLF